MCRFQEQWWAEGATGCRVPTLTAHSCSKDHGVLKLWLWRSMQEKWKRNTCLLSPPTLLALVKIKLKLYFICFHYFLKILDCYIFFLFTIKVASFWLDSGRTQSKQHCFIVTQVKLLFQSMLKQANGYFFPSLHNCFIVGNKNKNMINEFD